MNTTGAVSSALLVAASASADVIDFDSLGHETIVDDQFAGLDFNATLKVLRSNLARSPDNEAFGPPFVPSPTRIDAVGGEFTSLGAWFRGDRAGDVLTIKAFDSLNFQIGSVSFNTPASGLTHGFLSISTADTGGLTIASVEITISGVGYSMDDLEFAQIPLPSAVLLCAGGLAMLASRRPSRN